MSYCEAWDCCIHPANLRMKTTSRGQSSEMGKTEVLENTTELTHLKTGPTTGQLPLLFKPVELGFLLWWSKASNPSRDIDDKYINAFLSELG